MYSYDDGSFNDWVNDNADEIIELYLETDEAYEQCEKEYSGRVSEIGFKLWCNEFKIDNVPDSFLERLYNSTDKIGDM